MLFNNDKVAWENRCKKRQNNTVRIFSYWICHLQEKPKYTLSVDYNMPNNNIKY